MFNAAKASVPLAGLRRRLWLGSCLHIRNACTPTFSCGLSIARTKVGGSRLSEQLPKALSNANSHYGQRISFAWSQRRSVVLRGPSRIPCLQARRGTLRRSVLFTCSADMRSGRQSMATTC